MDPILSIIVPTYGQEKYIAQALDSILMQKTKYSYEVLVGEDASPDNTRAILKEYDEKYPGIFTMYYRDINMRSVGKSNAGDLKRRAKGKYFITLEGDDYWIDEYKIETQIDFLEKHPDYIAVAHNCLVVDANSKPNGEQYPECHDDEYTLKHYMYDILPGQLTTLMTKNYYRFPLFDTSILGKGLSPGDRLLYFALVSNGKVFCIQKKMSAYRHVKKGGSSFSANYVFDYNKEEKWHSELLQYARTINNRKAIQVATIKYFAYNFHSFRCEKITFKTFLTKCNNLNHLFYVIIRYIGWKMYSINHKTNFE